MNKTTTLFLITIFYIAQPLHALHWRKVALYTTGVVAVGGCVVGAYYFFKKDNKPCEPVVVPTIISKDQPWVVVPVPKTISFEEQMKMHFNNFEYLIQHSHEDLGYVIEFNKLIVELQKDEASEKLLCTVLRHKKDPSKETLFTLAQKGSSISTRKKFEYLYALYDISI